MAKKTVSITKGYMKRTKSGRIVPVKGHRNNLVKTSVKKKK